jgi:hypothetical protein
LAQNSPFLTGATALQTNILAWLTPIAVILVMVLGAMAMANRITSIHAASAELALEQLVLLVKQSRAGRELCREDIKQLLYLLVDIVIQFDRQQHWRGIKEIWYQPESRRKAHSWLGS